MKVYEEWIPFWLHQSVGALVRLIGRPVEWYAEAVRRLSMPTVPSDAGDQVLVYVRAEDPWCRLWVVGWPDPAARQLLRWLLPTQSPITRTPTAGGRPFAGVVRLRVSPPGSGERHGRYVFHGHRRLHEPGPGPGSAGPDRRRCGDLPYPTPRPYGGRDGDMGPGRRPSGERGPGLPPVGGCLSAGGLKGRAVGQSGNETVGLTMSHRP
jgi:hypothetical protein